MRRDGQGKLFKKILLVCTSSVWTGGNLDNWSRLTSVSNSFSTEIAHNPFPVQSKYFTFSGNTKHPTSIHDFEPSAHQPALQYIEKIDKGSVAEKAGLIQGDYLLEVRGFSRLVSTIYSIFSNFSDSRTSRKNKTKIIKFRLEHYQNFWKKFSVEYHCFDAFDPLLSKSCYSTGSFFRRWKKVLRIKKCVFVLTVCFKMVFAHRVS